MSGRKNKSSRGGRGGQNNSWYSVDERPEAKANRRAKQNASAKQRREDNSARWNVESLINNPGKSFGAAGLTPIPFYQNSSRGKTESRGGKRSRSRKPGAGAFDPTNPSGGFSYVSQSPGQRGRGRGRSPRGGRTPSGIFIHGHGYVGADADKNEISLEQFMERVSIASSESSEESSSMDEAVLDYIQNVGAHGLGIISDDNSDDQDDDASSSSDDEDDHLGLGAIRGARKLRAAKQTARISGLVGRMEQGYEPAVEQAYKNQAGKIVRQFREQQQGSQQLYSPSSSKFVPEPAIGNSKERRRQRRDHEQLMNKYSRTFVRAQDPASMLQTDETILVDQPKSKVSVAPEPASNVPGGKEEPEYVQSRKWWPNMTAVSPPAPAASSPPQSEPPKTVVAIAIEQTTDLANSSKVEIIVTEAPAAFESTTPVKVVPIEAVQTPVSEQVGALPFFESHPSPAPAALTSQSVSPAAFEEPSPFEAPIEVSKPQKKKAKKNERAKLKNSAVKKEETRTFEEAADMMGESDSDDVYDKMMEEDSNEDDEDAIMIEEDSDVDEINFKQFEALNGSSEESEESGEEGEIDSDEVSSESSFDDEDELSSDSEEGLIELSFLSSDSDEFEDSSDEEDERASTKKKRHNFKGIPRWDDDENEEVPSEEEDAVFRKILRGSFEDLPTLAGFQMPIATAQPRSFKDRLKLSKDQGVRRGQMQSSSAPGSVQKQKSKAQSKKAKLTKKKQRKRGFDFEPFTLSQLLDWNQVLREFVRDKKLKSMPLAPMGRVRRYQMHQLSNYYGLSSQSYGTGLKRYPSVSKTKRTVLPPENDVENFIHAVVHQENEVDDDDDQIQGQNRGGKFSQANNKKNKNRGQKRDHNGGSKKGGAKSKSTSVTNSPGPQQGKLVAHDAEPIGHENKGFHLLMKMGWTGGGLGSQKQGIAAPIDAVIKTNKRGLGYD